MTNIIPIPIRKFWNSLTIPIPIRTEVGSANLSYSYLWGKQGQGNQCRTPGVKFWANTVVFWAYTVFFLANTVVFWVNTVVFWVNTGVFGQIHGYFGQIH